MVQVARGTQLDTVLAGELAKAPKLIREYGELLEPVAGLCLARAPGRRGPAL